LAVSISIEVTFRNELDSTVVVEMTQYWPRGDVIARPESWDRAERVWTAEAELLPGGSTTGEIDPHGWLVWRAKDYGTGRLRCEGEVDFARNWHSREITIDRKRCGNLH
jgi:hypothetical protein